MITLNSKSFSLTSQMLGNLVLGWGYLPRRSKLSYWSSRSPHWLLSAYMPGLLSSQPTYTRDGWLRCLLGEGGAPESHPQMPSPCPCSSFTCPILFLFSLVPTWILALSLSLAGAVLLSGLVVIAVLVRKGNQWAGGKPGP